jgi:hypothetical protein
LILFKGARTCVAGVQKLMGSESHFASAVQNGRLQADFDGLQDELPDLPNDYATDLQKLLVRAGAFPLAALMNPRIGGRERTRTPGKFIEISNLKWSEEALSLNYTLKFLGLPDMHAFGGTLACTLRLDRGTGLMTSRRMTAALPDGDTLTVTETYDLILDAEILDSLLNMPDRSTRKPAKPGGWKPTECFNNQCVANPADVKEGRWVTYASKAGGQSVRMSTRVVGKAGNDWLIESWMEMPSMKYGYLFQIGADRVIKKAWAAADGDPNWTAIAVREPPKPAPGGPQPIVKESNEKKEVKAGSYDCTRLDVTVNVQGKEYTSTSWYSKDVWMLANGSEKGGMVAMESSGATYVLEAKGEDARPTIPLPKE